MVREGIAFVLEFYWEEKRLDKREGVGISDSDFWRLANFCNCEEVSVFVEGYLV